MFQVMQGVVVTDEELEVCGQAGCVVDPNEDGKVIVKMDADGALLQFDANQIRGL